MGATQIISHNHSLSDNTLPVDGACVLFLGGSGITDTTRATKLVDNIAHEILEGIADIPNYVLVYDADILGQIKKTTATRLIQFDKYGQNILKQPTEKRQIYISPDNAERVFRQRIAPLIKKNGQYGTADLQLVADGDMGQIFSVLEYNTDLLSAKLELSESDTNAIKNSIRENTFSYSKHFEPEYIDELFKNILLPRITGADGNKLPLCVAQKRIRNLNIVAHCHGAYVALILAEKMQKKMQELGYTATDIDAIQSQLLVVALAPSCPLGKTKTRFISFMSAYDSMVERPENWVSQYVSENRKCDLENINAPENNHVWDLQAGFLDGKNGDVFYAKQRFALDDIEGQKKISWNEHNNSHFESEKFTDDGRLLATIARNIIRSGIKNSMNGGDEFTPLPPTEDLILDGKNDNELSSKFEQLQENGRAFLKTVCDYARKQVKKMMSADGGRGYRHSVERF